ncbi:MAG: peptide chain release factor 1 [Campylobacteraceae bacterium]|jgi:peptide chain release factor 1|nr:peptide chain release factor 1 [Campylobacteraceae bacterium]MBT3882852.1 peptide chain release factor 1 [Campylobacteraceae bacterium]MBT4030278.1 peptide chain release factor 1 [Campylobacteraceae bacterium]MBT4179620.1 peptide chain release factor 1 [Campylobacteraceae bacterium]MBT4572989.1 peptide chain release factor 1 [Campylobacteraceae bacterium]
MLQQQLQSFIDRYNELTDIIVSPEVMSDIKKMTELSKEQSSIKKIVDAAHEYNTLISDIDDNKSMLDDPELGELAKEELKELENRKPELEEEIKLLLLPKDPNDDKNIFIELRAGAGGDEAGLFVADLFRTYIKFAENQGWKTEIMNSSESEAGGFKEMVFLVKGESVYSKMKFESGVHRVQRVPATETQGRVHTSAITVAIIPEVDDIEIEIKAEDLKIDTMRASGCGGQSVNTTDSAIRITHLPTGLVVTNQDQKSQHKNREKAMKVLKARLHDLQEQERMQKEGADRKEQVGSGDRSARIRTYNYPQGRISDHRINLTLYRLDAIMNDGLLNEVIDPLIADHQAKLIESSGL